MNIQEKISKNLLSHDSVNVIIAGITCSGKTTLANEIREYFSDKHLVTIVAQDDYFKNLADIPRVREGYLTDSIEAFHVEEFKSDVKKLLTNGIVTMPEYDIATNTRVSKKKIVRAGSINVFEGLHTIQLLNDLNNSIRIYINTNMDVCLKRRIERDTSKFGVPEVRIREYWNDCIKPMCYRYILIQKENADITLDCKDGGFYDS